MQYEGMCQYPQVIQLPYGLHPNRSNNATSQSPILSSSATRTSSSQSSFLKVPLSLSADGYHIWWLWTQLRSAGWTPRGTNHSRWTPPASGTLSSILRVATTGEPIFRLESRKANESLSVPTTSRQSCLECTKTTLTAHSQCTTIAVTNQRRCRLTFQDHSFFQAQPKIGESRWQHLTLCTVEEKQICEVKLSIILVTILGFTTHTSSSWYAV